ncbi:hypothetical protein G647_09954 [Cladophialophora carrionii CBS 160.54]|uniref:Uncharacterized protein n=1 Tax=Cladophialophora carrionii CBS 160.54 TaxID=1279043 RepID=V9DKM9_9EURO|nr:uncharacterized protein G647_09954 [Cladophialophora carrionii CBS 160.54]ETI27271.1 hypothetical protein G647_09954 [Cladophialophora carrionii CBS 160.54]
MPNMIQPALPDLAAIPFKRTKPSPATKVDSTPQPTITNNTAFACPDGTAASAPNSYSISTSTSNPQPGLRSTRPEQRATASYPSSSAEKANGSTHTTNLPGSVFNENMQSAGFTIVRRRSTKSAAQPTPNQQEKQKQKQAPEQTTGSRYNLLAIEEPEADNDLVSEATGTDTSPLAIAVPKNTTATNKKKSRKPKKNEKGRADTKPAEHLCVSVASDRPGEGSGTSVPQQEQDAADKDEGEDKEGEGEKTNGGRGFLNIMSRPEYLFLIVWVVLAEMARRIFDVKTGQEQD